ncbi:cation:dicarboxylate symporter family transporter [Micromonospora sp. PLK6-60]|uniref:cation:dicarboxylate symporter family transporter n=1 Tax=Micromonospora sp. PLK6-60 TaxID=2873383 RepID=UPI002105586C|nr:cation:dicarboxylase symporter family transporter [Micromonospora sp. PLK6-60]
MAAHRDSEPDPGAGSTPGPSLPAPAGSAGGAPPGDHPVAEPARRRDRTRYLYLAVIVAVLAGIAVGLLFPDVGKSLKPLGDGFVALIKMMIGPVIFCTIVLGVGSVRKAAQVGKVGGPAVERWPGADRGSRAGSTVRSPFPQAPAVAAGGHRRSTCRW